MQVKTTTTDISQLKEHSRVIVDGAEYFVFKYNKDIREVELSLLKKDGNPPKKRIYCSKVGYYTPVSKIQAVVVFNYV